MHEIISSIVINKINAELESERLRAKIRVDMARRTGEKRDASGLKTLGGALSLVGGAVALKAPLLQARLAGGAVALGGGALTLSADLIEQMDKLEYSVSSLSEVLETYRKNLATIAEMGQRAEGPKTTEQGKVIVPAELRKTQEIAEWGNEAVVTGLAATWEGLAGQLNALRKFGGKMVDPSAERGIIRQIEAVRDALGEILNMADDPRAARLLSRMQGFLGRNAPAGPFFGEGGEPRAGGRVMPRSLGRRSGFSGGSGDDVLFGGAGSDTLGEPLLRLGGNAEVAARGFAKLAEQGKRFEALTGPLATGLAETNTLLGSQADRLRGLGGLLPELGRQLIDVFDSGTVGAERLDAAVQAVGDRFLDAFEGAIRRGESLGDVLKSLARDLAELALQEVKTGGVFGGLVSGGACWFAGAAGDCLVPTEPRRARMETGRVARACQAPKEGRTQLPKALIIIVKTRNRNHTGRLTKSIAPQYMKRRQLRQFRAVWLT